METDPDRSVVRRELETDVESPAIEVARAVADIEETEPTELPNMYDCVDGILDELFSTPPADDAQMEISFSYSNYRVTVEQNGLAEFVRTTDD